MVPVLSDGSYALMERFQSNVKDCIRSTAPIYQRLVDTGKIDKAILMTGLDRIDIASLYFYHSFFSDVRIEEVKKRVDRVGGSLKYNHDLSTVIWKDGIPIAVMIVADTDMVSEKFIYSVVVAKEFRQTPISVLVKHETFLKLSKEGVINVIYYAFNNNSDTLRHAQKIGYQLH